ncbi:MAG: leucyl/phenylalanyl-tRNA--protein transferase [Pseudomonadota bacterium]
MAVIRFPDPRMASDEGIVAIGGDLSVKTLLAAYSEGIFPWPHEGYPLLWFCPWERGVLEFKNLHISKSLQKLDKKTNWTWTVDRAFDEVIGACAEVPRPGQSGTWITEDVLSSYRKFHLAGYAHSLEVWEKGDLVGGIYGVFVKNVFSAESMFFKKSNASKWALWKLVNFLQTRGLEWIDVQMVTTVCEHFGARLISQQEFLEKVRKSQAKQPITW